MEDERYLGALVLYVSVKVSGVSDVCRQQLSPPKSGGYFPRRGKGAAALLRLINFDASATSSETNHA